LSVRMSCQATLQGSNLRFRLVGHPLPRTWCLKTGAGWVGTVGKNSVAQCGTPRSFIRYFCEQQMRLARPPWLMSVVNSSRACLAMAGCLSLTQFPAGGERVQLGHSYLLDDPKPLIARVSSNNFHVWERRRGLARWVHCYMIHVQAIDRATRRLRPLAPRLKVDAHSGSLSSRAARRH
jgi:hypothetical protein